MTLFWSHLLLGEHGYSGNPLRQHMGLSMWTSTVMANFRGPTADDAIIKARNIAHAIRSL